MAKKKNAPKSPPRRRATAPRPNKEKQPVVPFPIPLSLGTIAMIIAEVEKRRTRAALTPSTVDTKQGVQMPVPASDEVDRCVTTAGPPPSLIECHVSQMSKLRHRIEVCNGALGDILERLYGSRPGPADATETTKPAGWAGELIVVMDGIERDVSYLETLIDHLRRIA